MDTHVRLRVFGNGDVTITFAHSEIDQQIELLKAIVSKKPDESNTVDDVLNCLQLLRIMKK